MTALTDFIGLMSDIQRHGPVANQIKKLSDGIYEQTLFLSELNKHKTPWTDGAGAMIWNLVKNKQKGEVYIGAQKLNTTVTEPLDTGIVLRWWINRAITYNKTDLDQNKGDKMVPYVGSRIDAAKKDMGDTVELMLLGNNTTDAAGTTITGAPHPVGLQYLLSTTGTTGTVENINKANTSNGVQYWKSQAINFSTVAGVTTALMQQLWMRCRHGYGPPTFAMTNDNLFRSIWALAKTEKWSQREYVLKAAYELGYPEAIEFSGCPIVPSKHMTGTTSSGELPGGDLKKLYVLNSKTFRWEIDPSDDFKLEDTIKVADQRTLVQHLGINGSFALTDMWSNGVGYYS